MLGKKKDAVAAIKSESSGVMSIFTSTVSSLEAINTKADVEINKRAEQIVVLKEENAALDLQVAENKKVVSKITDFLNS